MKKLIPSTVLLLVLFSCASLPKAEQDAYDKLRESILNNDFSAMDRVFTGTDKDVVRRIINRKDPQGNTLLLLAASSARVTMVEAFLKNGANPDIAGQNKQTPLHIAAANQYTGVVDLLLRYKANKNLKDGKGKTPLDYAFEAKNSALVQALNGGASPSSGGGAMPADASPASPAPEPDRNASGDIQSQFLAAVEQNNVDAVRRLMAGGKVDMYRDVPGAGSRSPMPILLWAIDTRRSDSIIEEIINYYIEPLDEIVDRDGRNAWFYAALRNNKRVQNLLEKKGISTTNAANTQW